MMIALLQTETWRREGDSDLLFPSFVADGVAQSFSRPPFPLRRAAPCARARRFGRLKDRLLMRDLAPVARRKPSSSK